MVEKLKGKENFSNWKYLMQLILEERGLWSVISGEVAQPEASAGTAEIRAFAEKNRRALILLGANVEASQLSYIKPHALAKAAWDELCSIYERVAAVNKLYLRDQLRKACMHEGESMQVYINRVRDIAMQLDAVGASVDEAELVLVLLEGLPKSYTTFVTALEAGSSDLVLNEVMSKLLHEELRRHPAGVKAGESAYLGRGQVQQPKRFPTRPKPTCYHCGKVGHIKRECRTLKRQQHQQQQNQGFVQQLQGRQNASVGSTSDFVFTATPQHVKNSWFIDSGASMHMCNNKASFSTITTIEPKSIFMGDGTPLAAVGVGNVPLTVMVNGKLLQGKIEDVLYVPKLAANLLSVRQLMQKGCRVDFSNNSCFIKTASGQDIGHGIFDGSLYRLATPTNQDTKLPDPMVLSTNFSATKGATAQLWHERFGHLGMQNLQQLATKEMVKGLPARFESRNPVCSGCMMGKQSRSPFSSSTSTSSQSLQLVHSDLCGPMQVPSLGGARYFCTFIDDYTRYTSIYFLKSKDECFSRFLEFKAGAENFCGCKIKCLRTDGGGEYVNKQFEDYLRQNGIQAQRTAAYTPQQNGVAERANRTIMETARSMLCAKDLPSFLWAEAVATAVVLKNISPTSALKEKTPAELWTGRKPNAASLRIFGCQAYVQVPDGKRGKLDAKSIPCIFVGYSLQSKAYRFYDPALNRIIVSRDVYFDESASLCKNFQKQQDTSNPFVSLPDFGDDDLEVQEVGEVEDAAAEAENEGDDDVEPAQQVPRRSTRQRQPPQPYWLTNPELAGLMATIPEPATFSEAMQAPHAAEWRKAAEDEIKSILDNKVWSKTELPQDRSPVGCKWIFRIKRKSDGSPDRFKARLVAQGFSQVPGFDYNETFAPVAKFPTVRLMLSWAAANDWEIHQMDVKCAFLNGDLDEEVYMQQPEGFIAKGEERLVLKLHKSLYGLKQSPRAWNQKLDKALHAMGFKRSMHEACLYFKQGEGGEIFLIIYVDDIIIMASNLELINTCKDKLHEQFQMSDMGEAEFYLGIQIKRNRGAKQLTLHQGRYIGDILDRFELSECAPTKTPMSVGTKLIAGSEQATDQEFVNKYQKAVGSLMYLMVATRPDLAYSVGAVSQHMSNPTFSHWTAIKRIFRYVKATHGWTLTLGAKETKIPELVGFTDADWGANEDNRKSIGAYCFLFGSGIISWCSKKQSAVALSSTEAEYMALTQATKEAVWLQAVMKELGLCKDDPILLNVDNQSCVALAKNPAFHGRTKHIDIQFHYVRDKVEDNSVTLQYCPTQEMVADILTKPLPRDKHQWCCDAMGLKLAA